MEATKTAYIGLPLWDEVKKSIFQDWLDCNTVLFEIDQIRLHDAQEPLGSRELKFRAGVLRLYRSCRAKLNYHSDEECVKQLKALNLDALPTEKFSLELALQAFYYLTFFIEKDGVTFFEKKVPDAMHGAVTQLEEGD